MRSRTQRRFASWRAPLLGSAFAAGLALSPLDHAQAGLCLNPAETGAMQVRSLQLRLMVAALQCGRKASYNEFATSHRSSLAGSSKVLRRYFRRAHGATGTRRLDSFETSLTNRFSLLSLRDRPGFCGDADRRFYALSTGPVGRLGIVAREVSGPVADDRFRPCRAETRGR